MPAALTLILICPWPGSASGTPAHFSTSGGPYLVITTALGMAAPSRWWVARLVRSDRRQRLGFGHGPAQRTVFVQVAEHLDADGLVQAAGADRFVATGADQISDQVARGVVV